MVIKKVLPITVAFGLTCLVSLAWADAPIVDCVGTESGGSGPRLYAYEVGAGFQPVMDFWVGTNDLDPGNYTNVLIPNNWSFSVEEVPMAHYLGLKTPHGEVSPGPSASLTAGSVHWWTDDPDFAVEYFTFGYDNTWPSEDVGWILEGYQELMEGEPYTMTEFWDVPVGDMYGPVHGPVPEPSTLLLLGLGSLALLKKRRT